MVPWSAPLRNHVPARPNGALHLDKLAAHGGAAGDRSGGGGYLPGSYQFGHLFAVELHAPRRHVQPQAGSKHGKGVLIGKVEPRSHCGQSDGPVHCAGVEDIKPEPPSQLLGRAALAGAGGAVDGDNQCGHCQPQAA